MPNKLNVFEIRISNFQLLVQHWFAVTVGQYRTAPNVYESKRSVTHIINI